MTTQGSGARGVIARFFPPVLRPTRDSVRRLALASVIANAVLVCTGAAVRLSSSGLGCPDWPQCTQASVVAAHSAGQTSLNTAIEFGNRLLTFPLAAIAALTFIACLRYQPDGRRRRDLVLLSALLPGGVIAQAVAGGLVVLTRLNPVMVTAHFLLSSAILAAAVVLHARVGEGQGPTRPLVRADLRVLAGLLSAATALMLTAGTVVTGTGPLAGTVIDSHGRRTTVPRFGFPLQDVTQLHAEIGWFTGAIAVALAIGLHFTDGPARAARASRVALAGLAVQAATGYTQYFSRLPAGLVWVHVSISAVLWILVLRLYLSTRERQPLPAATVTRAGPAPAAGNPLAPGVTLGAEEGDPGQDFQAEPGFFQHRQVLAHGIVVEPDVRGQFVDADRPGCLHDVAEQAVERRVSQWPQAAGLRAWLPPVPEYFSLPY